MHQPSSRCRALRGPGGVSGAADVSAPTIIEPKHASPTKVVILTNEKDHHFDAAVGTYPGPYGRVPEPDDGDEHKDGDDDSDGDGSPPNQPVPGQR